MTVGNTEVIKMMVNNDPTIPDETRKEIINALNRKGKERKPKLITRKQAAEILACSTKTIDRYIERGLIKEIRFTQRRIKFNEASIITLAREGVAA
jgi:predicted transcriptional regulator YheO